MTYQGFENHTPFAAEPFLLADEQGRAVLTLVAKGTYDLLPRGGIALAASQGPIHRVPVHHGEGPAALGSLRYEHEAAFTKVAVDVVLLGHAQPERGRATELDVGLRVGALRKQVRVFGDRVWRRGAGGRGAVSAPLSFERMPLVYERAFGGKDDPRNPVGVGFVAPSASTEGAPLDDEALPNLEDPGALLHDPDDRPAPACFGFVAPGWSPRRLLAGTFDDAWRASRFPRLPVDFDRRHLNAAPLDQQLRALRGGEPVEIINASHRGPIRFELPRLSLRASVRLRGGEPRAAPMTLDTLVLDADAHRFHVVFRTSFGIHGKLYDLEWSRIHLEQEGNDGQQRRA